MPPTETAVPEPTPAPTEAPVEPSAPAEDPSFFGGLFSGIQNVWVSVVSAFNSLFETTDDWINPTPAPTRTPLPPTPTESATPTPYVPPQPTVTPTVPPKVIVVNTGGDGVYIRREPTRSRAKENLIRLWPDGSTLTPTGENIRSDDWEWYKVRDSAGNVGWVPKQYLREGN